jgi:hypothetical protein
MNLGYCTSGAQKWNKSITRNVNYKTAPGIASIINEKAAK